MGPSHCSVCFKAVVATAEPALYVLQCAHRSRELSELRAHLAEEKGTLEAVKKEVNSTDQRAHKQVGCAKVTTLCMSMLSVQVVHLRCRG